ncbi:pimeloyl-ACP methyl ester carboxylesterase [Antricoccus suffuscus]|uniref:Pimeloyl-ACP methyl ester carboxylesterase n=1 Tax=Antricoccus suffuscus TaxID=1629062 RepID=A0A2T0ZWR9_9ACTN|nr:alpha/beta hydrolase [Antricoccus suffuscus]PRZ40528.1 pimeloyl-ACP methyl ester carboxylesterase [Antricoccus suffuscus]
MLQHQRTGSGRPIVLIHGLLGSQQIFSRVVPLLADEYEVVTVDLPGHGGSDLPGGANTMYDAAAELADMITGLSLTDPIVVGHSWGGYVTAELIASFPHTLSAAAIIYSQPYADPPEKQQARSEAISRFENEPWESVVRDLFPVYVADYDPPEIFEETVQITKSASVDAARFALMTIRDRADRSEAILAHPHIPVLFVSGTDDRSMPPITLQAPHIEYAETRSGHMGPMTVPDELVQILKAWIARSPAAGTT